MTTATITADTIVTISTAKGVHTGTVAECWRWQCEMQGAWASIELDDGTDVDVDDFDFDGEDNADDAIASLVHLIRSVVAIAD